MICRIDNASHVSKNKVFERRTTGMEKFKLIGVIYYERIIARTINFLLSYRHRVYDKYNRCTGKYRRYEKKGDFREIWTCD